MAEELKPCPFCGGKAVARLREDYSASTYAAVECTDCVAEIAIPYSNMADGQEELRQVIAAWNRRADPAPDAGVVAELVEALRGTIANACAAASIKGKEYIIVCTEDEWNAHVAATERARVVLAKLEGKANG